MAGAVSGVIEARVAAFLAAEIARLENILLLAYLRTRDSELGEECDRIVQRRRKLGDAFRATQALARAEGTDALNP